MAHINTYHIHTGMCGNMKFPVQLPVRERGERGEGRGEERGEEGRERARGRERVRGRERGRERERDCCKVAKEEFRYNTRHNKVLEVSVAATKPKLRPDDESGSCTSPLALLPQT